MPDILFICFYYFTFVARKNKKRYLPYSDDKQDFIL